MASYQDESYRIYEVVKAVKKSEWPQFAKMRLGLTEVEIEECEYNYHMQGMIEQRYQMVLTWQRKKGRIATVELLEQLLENRGERPQLGAPRPQEVRLAQRQDSSLTSPSGDAPLIASGDAPSFSNSRSEQSANVSFRSATEFQNSASNVTSGDTKQTPPKGNVNNGDYKYNETVPKKAFTGESAAVPLPNKISLQMEDPNGVQDSEIRRMSSGSNDSSLHGRASPVARDGKKSGSFTKKAKKVIKVLKGSPSMKKKLNEAHRVEAPSLVDIEDLCGLVKNIEVIPCDRNDYEKSLTDEGIYSITKPKGLALILNNTFKGTKNERKGAEIDVKNMTTLWKKFGCELYGNKTFPKPWKSDKTGKQMRDLLREVSEIKTKYSFIVIVIMTHGGIDKEKPVFEGSDHEMVEVKEIEKMFFNTKNGNLQNIPKFFIFQFCRGTIIDRGTIAADNKMKEPVMESLGNVCVQTDGARRMPTVSDIFVAYPTHEEHAAFRNIYEGSWFINAITNVFMRQAAKHHVADMLTIVNRAMKEKTGWCNVKASDGTNEAKAMSEQKTSLSQFFYLFPGFPE
uniref:caspase-1-A-like n=1 Tax=Styela clava TaxID=7725 RepID=UPI0019393E73|nr:caspase-1-A-like [Styela clava]